MTFSEAEVVILVAAMQCYIEWAAVDDEDAGEAMALYRRLVTADRGVDTLPIKSE